ncbi:MAG TPA: hypothetical protein VGZ73_26375 [Bryobacteraceae bacterium]|jgi:hypothetical protein|nr:hypothetical protein [Bryobacteraceae bacterium]
MKKTFGLIALLACSAAVTVSPALANGRNDNNYSNFHTTYVVDRNHDRRDDDRDRGGDQWDNGRYNVRYNSRSNGRYDSRSYGHDDGGYRR